MMSEKYLSIKIGDIQFQVDRKENLFLAQEVHSLETFPDYEDLIGIPKTGFGFGCFNTSGKRLENVSVDLLPEDTIISGYYTDKMKKEVAGPYKVKIYITYLIEE